MTMAKQLMQRVTVVDLKDNSTQTVFKAKGSGKRKKVSNWMRPTERVLRQTLKSQDRCWSDALKRHDKSRTKKRDRWLSDMLSNGLRAAEKGFRVWGRI
jgi:hypothetical protein